MTLKRIPWSLRSGCTLVALPLPVAVLVAGLASCGSDVPDAKTPDQQAGRPCADLEAKPTSPTPDASVLRDPDPGCHVVIDPVFTLAPSESGRWPDPGLGVVAQDRRGRLYVNSGWEGGGQILVWSSNGDFLRSIGRQGEGPGEFPRGTLTPFIGPRDSLYVVSRGRLTVFGPNYALARSVAHPPLSASPQTGVCIFDDGSFVSVGPTPGATPDQRFHVVNAAGSLVTSFATASNATRHIDALTPQAACTGHAVWTVADVGDPSAYVIERWESDGSRTRRLRRNAEWWNRIRETSPQLELQVVRLNVDAEGRIWIVLAIREPEPEPIHTHATNATEQARPLRLHYEVVEPDGASILVSDRLPDIPLDDLNAYPPFLGIIDGTNRAVGYRTDSGTGLLSREVVELRVER